jgi:hypothetical protein
MGERSELAQRRDGGAPFTRPASATDMDGGRAKAHDELGERACVRPHWGTGGRVLVAQNDAVTRRTTSGK